MYSKFTILFLLLCPIAVLAGKGEEEHKIRLTKEFTISKGGKLEVNNKYGKIIINIWDRNECKADIEIVGFGKTDDQAKKMAEMVQISQSGGGNSVKLETKYNPAAGNSWFFGGGGKKDSKDYVNVNYVISLPRSIGNLILKNNFGDILARELPFAESDIALNYGFLDIGNASNRLKLTMNYTDKAKVSNAEDLQVVANYSNLRCENVDKIRINSNNCNYVIGRAVDMRINCNYDDYKVNASKIINLNCNYTDMKMDVLQQEGTFSSTYTDVVIKRLQSSFKSISIDGRYSNYKIGMESNTAFRVSATMRYGDLNTKSVSLKDVKNIRKDQNLSFSAMTTNATDAAGLIKIAGAYCDVKLGGE